MQEMLSVIVVNKFTDRSLLNNVPGMDVYPATSRLLEFIPEPLLAGVLGGVAFMCLALVLLLGAACLISHKRERRRQKRRDGKRVPGIIHKTLAVFTRNSKK